MALYVYRNAITGRYCSKAFAFEHPHTTVRERVGLLKRLAVAVKVSRDGDRP